MLVDLRILMLIGLVTGIPKRFVVPRFLLVGSLVVFCGGYVGDLSITLVSYVAGLLLGNSIRGFHDKHGRKKNELV